jgi:hypothetical protein
MSVMPVSCSYCYLGVNGSQYKCGREAKQEGKKEREGEIGEARACCGRPYCSAECRAADWVPVPSGGRGQGHADWCSSTGSGRMCVEGVDWAVKFISEQRGCGVVALRPIPRGARIIVERAMPRMEVDAFCNRSSNAELVTEEESPVRQEVIAALEQLTPLDGTFDEKLDNNTLGTPDDGAVMCVRVARINHSCEPNAYHVYDPAAKCKVVLCQFPVRAGQEISISYVNAFDPSRRTEGVHEYLALLRAHWGIACPQDCVCADEEVLASVESARYLDSSIEQLCALGKLAPALGYCETLLDLYEDEDYHRVVTDNIRIRTLIDACTMAVMRADTAEKAQKFATLAHALLASTMGPKGAKTLEWERYAADVTTHKNYLVADKMEHKV